MVYREGELIGTLVDYGDGEYGSIETPNGDIVWGWKFSKRRWESSGCSWTPPKSGCFSNLYKKLTNS